MKKWMAGHKLNQLLIEHTRLGVIALLNGSIELRSFELKGYEEASFKKGKVFREDETIILTFGNSM